MGITQADMDALLQGPAPGQDAGEAIAPLTQPPLPAEDHEDELNRILHLSVPVVVKLADKPMPIQKVLQLKLGSVIEFDQPFDADLSLMVGNRCIGLGQGVKIGEHFGLRVTEIGDIGHMIKALGDEK